jgi:hypothetical protein
MLAGHPAPASGSARTSFDRGRRKMSVLMSRQMGGRAGGLGGGGPGGRAAGWDPGGGLGQVPTITFGGFGGVPDFLIMWVPFQPYT